MNFKESHFQSELINELEDKYPGIIILKNDAGYVQGFPDLLLLYEDKWAVLECKRNAAAPHRPNQDYYVKILGNMSYASFIYPENKETVLNELQQTFGSNRPACDSSC